MQQNDNVAFAGQFGCTARPLAFLAPCDVVEGQIEGFGNLRNSFVDEAGATARQRHAASST